MALKHVPVPHPSHTGPRSAAAARAGQRLRTIRSWLGETQEVFAERLGIRPDTLSGLELGRHQPSKTVMRLAEHIAREYGIRLPAAVPDAPQPPPLKMTVATCLTLSPEAWAQVLATLGLDPTQRNAGLPRSHGRVQVNVVLDRAAYDVLQRAAPDKKRYGEFVSGLLCARNGQGDAQTSDPREPGPSPKASYGQLISQVLLEYAAAQQQKESPTPPENIQGWLYGNASDRG